MVPEDFTMNALEISQRVNVGEKGIEKIRAKTGSLPLVEPVSIFKVSLRCIEDFYLHDRFFVILSLASAHPETVAFPVANVMKKPALSNGQAYLGGRSSVKDYVTGPHTNSHGEERHNER